MRCIILTCCFLAACGTRVDFSGFDPGGPATGQIPGSIAGVVTLEGESDHSGVEVRVPGTAIAARTAADGSFVIDGLAAGVYDLEAHQPDRPEFRRTPVAGATRLQPGASVTVEAIELQQPPAAVKIIKIWPRSGSSLAVTWVAGDDPDIAGYMVWTRDWRDSVFERTQVELIQGTEYEITDLLRTSIYDVNVTAVDRTELESEFSAQARWYFVHPIPKAAISLADSDGPVGSLLSRDGKRLSVLTANCMLRDYPITAQTATEVEAVDTFDYRANLELGTAPAKCLPPMRGPDGTLWLLNKTDSTLVRVNDCVNEDCAPACTACKRGFTVETVTHPGPLGLAFASGTVDNQILTTFDSDGGLRRTRWQGNPLTARTSDCNPSLGVDFATSVQGRVFMASIGGTIFTLPEGDLSGGDCGAPYELGLEVAALVGSPSSPRLVSVSKRGGTVSILDTSGPEGIRELTRLSVGRGPTQALFSSSADAVHIAYGQSGFIDTIATSDNRLLHCTRECRPFVRSQPQSLHLLPDDTGFLIQALPREGVLLTPLTYGDAGSK